MFEIQVLTYAEKETDGMGQIANQMVLEFYYRLKKKAREARRQKQAAQKQGGMK